MSTSQQKPTTKAPGVVRQIALEYDKNEGVFLQ